MKEYVALAVGIFLSICFLGFLFFYPVHNLPNKINSANVTSPSGNVSPNAARPANVPSPSANVAPKEARPANVPLPSVRVEYPASASSASGNVQLSAAHAEEFPSQMGEKQSEEYPSRKEVRQSGEHVKAVHAIGVYHGDYPEGDNRSGGTHREGIIDVTVKHNPDASPVTLVLMSYEPVEWRIRKESGAKVEQIILSSYLTCKVTGIDNVPVLREYFGYAYERMAFIRINMKIKEITGSEAKTFQGGYQGKYFDIY